MTTNDNFLNVTSKRLLGVSDFQDRFFDYLKNLVLDSTERMFDSNVVFGTALGLAGDTDEVTVSGTSTATDGDGHILDTANAYRGTAAAFENASGIDYYVGLHYCEVPQTVQINPRTGLPEYAEFIEEVGLSATPDSVVDNENDTITFNVNTLLESGVDHKGRYVTVYKVSPDSGAITDAIAIETIQVSYSSPNNTITTTGSLGQSTISTTASDYAVVLRGPVVSRNTDLSAEDGYTFLGIVTGVGAGSTPTVFDVTDQKVLPVSWASSFWEGIANDLFPATDSTYDLGTSSLKWANIYTDNLVISSDLLPVVDNDQNLGSASYSWKDLYIDGNIYGSLVPDVDNTRFLGSGAIAWQGAYINYGYFQRIYGEGNVVYTIGDLRPLTNNTFDLGSSALSYAEGHIFSLYSDALNPQDNTGITTSGDFFAPVSSAATDLGAATEWWKDAYIANAYVNAIKLRSGTEIAVDSTMHVRDLIPESTNTYDLGSSGVLWAEVHCTTLTTTNVGGDLVPNGAHDLGSNSNEWSTIYVTNTRTDSIVGEASTTVNFGSALFKPSTPAGGDLGDSTDYWDDIYVGSVRTDYLFGLNGGNIALTANIYLQADDTYGVANTTNMLSELYTHALGVQSISNPKASIITIYDDLVPDTTNDLDLGSSSLIYANVYATKVYANGLEANTGIITSYSNITVSDGKLSSLHSDGSGNMWQVKWISAIDMGYYDSSATGFDQNMGLSFLTGTVTRRLLSGSTDYMLFSTLMGYESDPIGGDVDVVVEIWYRVDTGSQSVEIDLDLKMVLRGEHAGLITPTSKSVAHNIGVYNDDDLHKTVFVFQSVATSGGAPFVAQFELQRSDSESNTTHVEGAVLKYRSATATEIFASYPSEG